jgi:lysophospholipid acyltransferase (LPLAT)-like uncharacterized protein
MKDERINLLKKKITFFLEKYLGSLLLFILGYTWKFEGIDEQKQSPNIYAFWHRNLLPLIYRRRNEKIGVIVSKSKDGEFVAGPLKVFGFETIRGSSSKNGANAAKNMIKYVKKNHVAITPDGPKGPIFEIKDGLTFIAYISKKPIVPISIEIDKEWILNSWDKFRIPKPFAHIKIIYHSKIYVKNKSEIDSMKNIIKKSLNN